MIRGAHVILYSADAGTDRDFLAHLLGTPAVDAGGGWTIRQLPPGEVAVHPADAGGAAELHLVCDDLDAELVELAARGIVPEGEPAEQGWGRLTWLRLPGGGRIGLYQAHHRTAFDL